MNLQRLLIKTAKELVGKTPEFRNVVKNAFTSALCGALSHVEHMSYECAEQLKENGFTVVRADKKNEGTHGLYRIHF